jgi:8-oxo-dGTP diphosphatase
VLRQFIMLSNGQDDKEMIQERFKLMPAVCVLLQKGDNILLLKRQNTGYKDGKYGFPGGSVDGDETILQAAIREAYEEVGVVIKEKDLDVIHVVHERYSDDPKVRYQGEAIVFLVRAYQWIGDPQIMEPNKCSEIKWCELENLPEETMDAAHHFFYQVKENKFYSEFGW